MHINVREFLAESVGYSRTFKISGERPELENVKLTSDIEGELTVSRLDETLLVRGRITTGVELECHRCLRTFSRPVNVAFQQVYAEKPSDDDLPITDHQIDLDPLVEQEIVLSLPLKILHAEDCTGIAGASEHYVRADTTN